MAKPNSLTTLIRQALAKAIEPMPPPGELWCISCMLNTYRQTIVIPEDAFELHVNEHVTLWGPGSYVQIVGLRVNIPKR